MNIYVNSDLEAKNDDAWQRIQNDYAERTEREKNEKEKAEKEKAETIEKLQNANNMSEYIAIRTGKEIIKEQDLGSLSMEEYIKARS